MRIVSVASRAVRWSIEARGSARGCDERAALLLELRDADGVIGLGEAAPLPDRSRDTLIDAERAFAALAARLPVEVGTVADVATLASEITRAPAASFAIETALLTMLAIRETITVGELLARSGGARASSLAIAAVVDDVADARAAFARGVRCLKLKIGGDDDLARIAAIADAVPGARLRLDANRGWPVAEAPARLAALAGLPIDFVEEPCAGTHLLLDRARPVPLALDESLTELTDVELAAALSSPSLGALVLKPTLLGLARTLALAGRAAAADVPIVVTHALEGPIGTAMCAELARAIGTAPAGLAPHPALAGWAVAVPQLGAAALHAAGPGLGWSDLTLASLCDPLALADDDRPALVAATTRSFAWCTTQLPAPADAIVATPTVETLLAIYAALAARRPIALHHHRLAADELARRRRVLAAATLPADAAVVLFTSGSTGLARGVVLSRDALVAAAQSSAAHLGWRADDRWLLALSLAHAGGLAVAVRCLAAKRPVVLAEADFEPGRVAALLDDAHVTLASLVPTQLIALLDDPRWRPPPRLRAVLLGGAPATPTLLARAAERGVPVLVTYGMTETFGQVATAPVDRAGDPDAQLVALPGVALDGGTPERPAPIRVRGPMLATQYLDGTPIAPVHVTSDLGYVADGVLHVVGRADDMIVSGGENVHPVEVEAVLAATPGVRAACVFGVADARWGQLVGAAVVVDADFDVAGAAHYWHATLAAHARPRRLAITAQLPLGSTGKPDRRAAATLVATTLEYR